MLVECKPLTFLRQRQIFAIIHLYGENVEKSFSQYVLKTKGWNLQYMIKEEKLFRHYQNFRGYMPLRLGYINV